MRTAGRDATHCRTGTADADLIVYVDHAGHAPAASLNELASNRSIDSASQRDSALGRGNTNLASLGAGVRGQEDGNAPLQIFVSEKTIVRLK